MKEPSKRTGLSSLLGRGQSCGNSFFPAKNLSKDIHSAGPYPFPVIADLEAGLVVFHVKSIISFELFAISRN